ncbi:MAG: alpha/beta hydrolase family protein [Mycobacteriales bacterium]
MSEPFFGWFPRMGLEARRPRQGSTLMLQTGPSRSTRLSLALGLALPLVLVGGRPALGAPPAGYDCSAAPPAAKPGTAVWEQREISEAHCGEQRFFDVETNPAFVAAEADQSSLSGGVPPEDPFRDPGRLRGHRFRFRELRLPDPTGKMLAAQLFMPCSAHSCHDEPAGLVHRRGPYPAVVVVHGGSASMQHYLWADEALAESGYMVLTFQVPARQNTGSAPFPGDTQAALDFLFATPARRDHGVFNPEWRNLARHHVGVAGHSGGAYGAIVTGQRDPRVSAIVSWDRAKSTPMPKDLPLRHPTLLTVSDYQCQQVPVCISQPYTAPPPFYGPGNKDQDFTRMRAAHVDTMKIAIRAGTHLDYTQFVPGTGSRYGAEVALYYTLAWFDRYLLGRMPHRRAIGHRALQRLLASRFDRSADIHNISGGAYDVATGRNVPAMIAGQPVIDRLSFHFRSGYWLDGGRYRCGNLLSRPAC